MRLARYRIKNRKYFGAVMGEDLFDLSTHAPVPWRSMQDVIAGGEAALAALRDAIKPLSPHYALHDVQLLPPVAAPEKIWCIGVNYPERNAEYADASAAPKYPSLFARVPLSLTGHGAPILRPRVSEQFDYEGELVLVIGKGGRHIKREHALSHVFGMTLCNEGSVRDWLRHGKFNVTQGKNFDSSGSIGPWIVTADELDPAADHRITTHVNGELRQDDQTQRLMFPFDYLISYLSTFATLKPGDFIVTGTPTGAGARFDPPRWLVPGDVVEVSSPGIGTLRNVVADEPIDSNAKG